jgi:hypothetical protein
MTSRWATVVVFVLLTVSGCVKPFSGSHIEFSLTGYKDICSQITASGFALPACKDPDDTTTYHVELWAVLHRSTMVRLAVLTLQRQVKPAEIEQFQRDGVILSSGKLFQYDPNRTLAQIEAAGQLDDWRHLLKQMSAITAITSYSPVMFQPGKEAEKRLADDYYVGNHQYLQVPFNGKHHGVVDGLYPLAPIPVGQAALDTDVVLDDLDCLFMTVENAPADRVAPGPSSYVLLTGTTSKVVSGAITVEALSPTDPSARAHFNVFTNLDERDYF